MSSYIQLLHIIKDTRQRLRNQEITLHEANLILLEVNKDYKELFGSNSEISMTDLFGDIIEQEDDQKFNFLL